MRRFRLVGFVLTIIFMVMWFIVSTWSHFSGGAGVGWPLAVAFLATGYIPVAILGFRWQHPLLRAMAIPAAVCVGLLSFGFIAAIACWALAAVAAAGKCPIGVRSIGDGVLGVALLAAVYGLVNAARIRVTRYMVTLPGLPSHWRGRIGVLITDVHLGNIRRVGFARRIVARIIALKPDIVFIGGDLFDGALVDLDACAEPWAAIQAPMGTFFVTGNHDEFSDSSKIVDALRKVGIRVLNNEKVTLDGLQILGVHDGVAREESEIREILARAQIDRNGASILLNHRPLHLSIPQEAGVSLQLSGHTHHGQVWPWLHLVDRIYGPFGYGLNRSGTLQVITSSGVGTWGPPMRVGTRSEIVLIQFL